MSASAQKSAIGRALIFPGKTESFFVELWSYLSCFQSYKSSNVFINHHTPGAIYHFIVHFVLAVNTLTEISGALRDGPSLFPFSIVLKSFTQSRREDR